MYQNQGIYGASSLGQSAANVGALNVPSAQEPSVRAALKRLEYNNEALRELMDSLVQRLSPVLGPENAVDCANGGRPPARCDMEQILEQQTDSVCARIRTLQSLLDRLEI